MKKILKVILHILAPAIVVLLTGSLTAFAASMAGRPVTDPLQIAAVKAFNATDLFQIQDKDGNINVTMDGATNRLGIGDTSPDAKLDVEANTTTAVVSINNTFDGNGMEIVVAGTTTKPVIEARNGAAATIFHLLANGETFSMPGSYADNALPTCTTAKTGWTVLSYDTVIPLSLEPSLCMCSRDIVTGAAEWSAVFSGGGSCP